MELDTQEYIKILYLKLYLPHSNGFKKNWLSGLPEIPVTVITCRKHSVGGLLTMDYIVSLLSKKSATCLPLLPEVPGIGALMGCCSNRTSGPCSSSLELYPFLSTTLEFSDSDLPTGGTHFSRAPFPCIVHIDQW